LEVAEVEHSDVQSAQVGVKLGRRILQRYLADSVLLGAYGYRFEPPDRATPQG
jgi:hypothetical protein